MSPVADYANMPEDEFYEQIAKDEEERKQRIAAGEEDPIVWPRPTRPRKKRASGPMPDDSCTQAANAERFAFTFAGRFRYLTDRQIWVRWDDRRWAVATEGDLLRAGKIIAQQIFSEAYDAPDEDKRKRLGAWALKTHTVAELRAMITLASSELTLEMKSSDFDQHHHLLNVDNGTIDLRDGSLREHRREDFISRLTPIVYDPSAVAPRWVQFNDEVFAEDKDLIAFVRRAVGYSLTGHTREHAFFIPYGNGMNGKSVFERQLMKLGGDAARTTSFATFAADRNKQMGNTPELAELAGMRIVTATEPDEGVRLSKSVIKSLTGDDEIQACKKYEAPFTFTPQLKLWVPTNHKPEIRGTDNGIWRRPRLIPFTVSFEGRADKRLSETLDAEQSGILAWAVQGARDWFANGLGECRAVVEATRGYREESDALGAFITDCIAVDAGGFTSNADLMHVYMKWCAMNGQEPWAQNTFSRRFKARGYESAKPGKGSVRGFKNVKATAPESNS